MKALKERMTRVSHIVEDENADRLLQEGNNNMSYNTDWPGSDDLRQAALIISWDGFPAGDFGGFTVEQEFKVPKEPNSGELMIRNQTEGVLETWVFMPLNTTAINLIHPKYGNVRIPLPPLKQHDIWSVPVVIDELMNIEVRPLTDYNKPVRVTLVNPETGSEQERMSPATFENVAPGSYNVRFAINGRNVEKPIIVTPTTKVFGGKDFDFRNMKEIALESTEKGWFMIDGSMIGEGSSIKTEVPYGTHTVTVKVDNELKDEKVIDVNEDSETIIYLSPIQSRTFEVVGLYQGKQVPTSIHVSGLSPDRYDPSIQNKHEFTLPVDGPAYKYYLSYQGHSGSKEIRVTTGMNTVQEVKLSADRTVVWPWQREYEAVNNWWEFSYVAKQYVTSGRLYDNGSSIKTTVKENGVWDDGYDHWLHGFRLGYHYQPAFKFGLGLYTGIFSEFYFSGADDAPIDVYDKYFEWDLSLPIHILYQVPLAKKFCVGFHTGVSLNVAAVGSYYDKLMPGDDDNDNVEDWDDFWSEPWAPNRFNVDWDFSLFIRWKKLMITGTLSRGLTDNKMHKDFGSGAKTVMNKAIISFSLGL